MDKCLVPVKKESDILPAYHNTPVGKLLEYHNLNRPHGLYFNAQILIGLCMDYRKQLRLPNCFSYMLRVGGGDLRLVDFYVCYAIAIGQVKAIALLGHNNCGMANLTVRKEQFIKGMVDHAGWDKETADEYFEMSRFVEINDEIEFTLKEAARLRKRYPKILVAPLFYNLDDHLLYQILEPATTRESVG